MSEYNELVKLADSEAIERLGPAGSQMLMSACVDMAFVLTSFYSARCDKRIKDGLQELLELDRRWVLEQQENFVSPTRHDPSA